jgi:hypothetical protein
VAQGMSLGSTFVALADMGSPLGGCCLMRLQALPFAVAIESPPVYSQLMSSKVSGPLEF